jgi:DNA processing protein
MVYRSCSTLNCRSAPARRLTQAPAPVTGLASKPVASPGTGPYPGGMISGSLAEHAALIALLRSRPDGLTWARITAELLEAGRAADVWERHAPAPALLSLPGEVSTDSAARDVQAWTARGYRLISILDADYPERLRGIHQAPPVIFTLGTVLADDPGVSVVGSRAASARGAAMAADIARALVARRLTVVSGLARGIDTAAHRAALDAGGRTVAVIGTGISRAYPAENRALQDEVARRGLVLSQFWPDAPADQHAFPMRNATMSGYGLATVVVEAGEKSGARIQARVAVEHGRPVILTDAVVARNAWARELLGRPGVRVARDADGVLDAVGQVVALWDELRRLVTPLHVRPAGSSQRRRRRLPAQPRPRQAGHLRRLPDPG